MILFNGELAFWLIINVLSVATACPQPRPGRPAPVALPGPRNAALPPPVLLLLLLASHSLRPSRFFAVQSASLTSQLLAVFSCRPRLLFLVDIPGCSVDLGRKWCSIIFVTTKNRSLKMYTIYVQLCEYMSRFIRLVQLHIVFGMRYFQSEGLHHSKQYS